MKRSVAILGPTPSFVRWAIRIPCALRQIDVDNLPDATFRQLRSLRELSLARSENRVQGGICFHATETETVDAALGFFADEVSDFFGGVDNIQAACGKCVANAVSRSQAGEEVWAGCYGWFRSEFSSVNYINSFQKASANWYKVWQTNTWENSELVILQKILLNIENIANDPALCELNTAVAACLENELTLETELVPGGDSDGLHWTINSHCPTCKFELPESQLRCDGCGRQGTPNRAVKRKVLGLRPYVKLTRLLGVEKTEKLLADHAGRASS